MTAATHPTSEGTYEDFYRSHYDRLVRFVVKIGARPEEAEDVAQEAMAQVFQRWGTLRSPYAWAKSAANSALIGAINRSKKEDWARKAIAHEGAGMRTQSHEWEAAVADGKEAIRQILRSLPPAQREAFAFTIDGDAPQEIAREVGKSPEAIRSNLRQARKRLRDALDPKRGNDDQSRKEQPDA